MKKSIIIVGAGGHGKSVADVILQQGFYHLIGFVDDGYPQLLDIWGFPILGKATIDALSSLRSKADCLVVAIGNNSVRESIFKSIAGLNFELPNVVHDTAAISPRSKLGYGCVIMAHTSLGAESTLGNGVVLNSGAIVDHNSIVEDFGHLGVNASMAGNTRLGRLAWAQAGVAIGYGQTIPSNKIIRQDTTLCS